VQWAALVVVLALASPIFFIEWRGMRTVSSRAVMRRLDRHGQYRLPVGRFSSVWFPEGAQGTEGFLQMPGKGRAIYTLDGTDKTVHVHWKPKRGPARDYCGPVPLAATREVRHKLRTVIAVVVSIYLVTGTVGTVVGAVEAHPHARVVATLIGLGGGLLVGYFISTWVGLYGLIRVVREAREKVYGTPTSRPPS
jgi:hypothetical protein